jgi:hypothetical protein
MYAGDWKDYQEYADKTDPDRIEERRIREMERREREQERAEWLAEKEKEERE